MGRATSNALDALHALVAESTNEELQLNLHRARQPRRIADPDDPKRTIPNPDYEPLSPKLLAVAIKFLKDNGIDAPGAAPRFNGIVEQLKNLSVDDENLLAN